MSNAEYLGKEKTRPCFIILTSQFLESQYKIPEKPRAAVEHRMRVSLVASILQAKLALAMKADNSKAAHAFCLACETDPVKEAIRPHVLYCPDAGVRIQDSKLRDGAYRRPQGPNQLGAAFIVNSILLASPPICS